MQHTPITDVHPTDVCVRQLVASAELDAVATMLLEGLEGAKLAERIMERWPQDPTYERARHASFSLNTFLGSLQKRSWRRLMQSAAWASLPQRARDRLRPPDEGGLFGRERVTTTCAAVWLLEANWARRNDDDVWLVGVGGRGSRGVDLKTRGDLLWGDEVSRRPGTQGDPHDVIFSTVYEDLANGYYGGDTTFVWAADV